MKILFLRIGGFSHVNDKLINEFESRGHEVIEFDILEHIHYKSWRAYPFSAPLMLLAAFWQDSSDFRGVYKKTAFAFKVMSRICERVVNKCDADIVLQTQTLFGLGVVGEIKKPYYIYTDYTHDLYNRDCAAIRSQKKMPLVTARSVELEKSAYESTDKVFVYTSYLKENLVTRYSISEDTVNVVGMGINVDYPDGYTKNAYHENLLFVGIDFNRKGGDLVIKAFSQVKEKYPNAKLRIVGCDVDISESNVEVLGRLSLDDLRDVLKDSDVFVMPSYQEPSGVAYLEAMAYQLPCVGVMLDSLTGHMRHEENCTLVERHDPKLIADAIIQFLDNPEMARQYGVAGQTMVRENYTWSMVAEKMLERFSQDIADVT